VAGTDAASRGDPYVRSNTNVLDRSPQMHRSPLRRRHLAAALFAVSALGLAACGDDNNDVTSATTAAPFTSKAHVTTAAAPPTTAAAPPTTAAAPPTTAAAPPTTAAAADLAAYCDAEVAVQMTAAAQGDPDADPKAFAAALVEPATAAAAKAPAGVSELYKTQLEALKGVAASGDPSGLGDGPNPDIIAFDKANCGWTKVDVHAEDYHFMGLPATMKAGTYDFELTNRGKEFHVLVILTKKPGVTDSFDQLIQDPAGESKVVTVGANGAQPGGSGSVITKLEPGEYMALCPIPLGSAPGAPPGTGAPHFTVGMRQMITVTA
jgi:hypothetical protein